MPVAHCCVPPRLVALEGIVNLLSRLSRARLMYHTRGMRPLATNRYKHYRFPAEISSHGVWLYCRFCLSYHDVEELLFACGIIVTYETIRKWCRKFGRAYANQLCHRRPQPGDKWHLAAKKFFRKPLKGCQYVPQVIITDKLKSYGAAKREIIPNVDHCQHRSLNNRPENSHQPTASGSGACKGSSRQDRPSGFSPPMAPLRSISAHGGIACWRRPTGKGCGTDSTPGRTLQTSLPLPKAHDRRQPCRFLSHDHVNVQEVDKAWQTVYAAERVVVEAEVVTRGGSRPDARIAAGFITASDVRVTDATVVGLALED